MTSLSLVAYSLMQQPALVINPEISFVSIARIAAVLNEFKSLVSIAEICKLFKLEICAVVNAANCRLLSAAIWSSHSPR
jgi:hypothetical protein